MILIVIIVIYRSFSISLNGSKWDSLRNLIRFRAIRILHDKKKSTLFTILTPKAFKIFLANNMDTSSGNKTNNY